MGKPHCNEGRIDEETFRNYVAAFNRSDFDGLGRYYAQDVEFEGRAATLRGRDELLRFYRDVKTRVRETLAIQDIVVGNSQLVADVITELHPLEDWLDFPTGPLRKGETRRSQNFVWYDIAEGRFTRIRAAHYRRDVVIPVGGSESLANRAQCTEVRMPGQSRQMTVEEFEAYIEAFNRDDFSRFSACYHPEVVLIIGGQHELHGPQEICNFYRRVKTQTRRTIRIANLICTADRIAAELESEFLALDDVPDFTAGPLKKGDRMFLNTVVLYELRDGRFLKIRSAALRKLRPTARIQ
jgi:ketosteroid isomerase-like protein